MSFARIEQQRLLTPLRGTFLNLGSSLTARMAAQLGFDWVLIDLEHGACTEASLPELLLAVEGTSCAPIVRVVSNNADSIKRALDLGAVGIMVPYVSTAADAGQAVSSMRYPPAGQRGVASSTIATSFGLQTDTYHQTAHELLTIVQIETLAAVQNADAIAATPGVDVLFVGPLDLSFNLGCPKQFDHPDLVAAKDRVVQACRQHRKAAGILCNIDNVAAHQSQGFSFIAVGSDAGAARDGLERLRDAGASSPHDAPS